MVKYKVWLVDSAAWWSLRDQSIYKQFKGGDSFVDMEEIFSAFNLHPLDECWNNPMWQIVPDLNEAELNEDL